ncbi:putative ribonuclease H-like domain-containing protein, partial [Tanacetum coccineum]
MLSNYPLSLSTQSTDDKDDDEVPDKGDDKEGYANRDSTASPSVSTVGPSINTASENINTGSPSINTASPIPNDSSMQSLENTSIFDDAYDDREVGVEAELNNLDTTMNVKPKKVIQALTDPSWIEPMQDELLQFKLQKVLTLVDLPKGKRAIGTKIEAIRLFLAYASFMGLIVYQMDVKSAFLYGTIEDEVYVCQPPGFEDPQFSKKVYKVKKALYGLHQAPRAWYKTLSTHLLENGFRRGTIDKTLFIKKDRGDILLVQVYVDDIIFGSTKKSLCDEFKQIMHKRFQISSMRELTFFLGLQTITTPIETNKVLIKDEEAEDVDVYLYRSMIGSLMYLTTSRLDIMFAVCACARKSTTGGCQFLVKRLISWQCKKQTKVANSTTEAEYVAAANCCGQ